MSMINIYVCDCCDLRSDERKTVTFRRIIGWGMEIRKWIKPAGEIEHLCEQCYADIQKAVMKVVHDRNE